MQKLFTSIFDGQVQYSKDADQLDPSFIKKFSVVLLEVNINWWKVAPANPRKNHFSIKYWDSDCRWNTKFNLHKIHLLQTAEPGYTDETFVSGLDIPLIVSPSRERALVI